MQYTSIIDRIDNEITKLDKDIQLEIAERIIHRIRNKESNTKKDEDFDWNRYYGIAKGLWDEDAQEYVDRLREDREF